MGIISNSTYDAGVINIRGKTSTTNPVRIELYGAVDSDNCGYLTVNDTNGNPKIMIKGVTTGNVLSVIGNSQMIGDINFTGNLYQNGVLFNNTAVFG